MTIKYTILERLDAIKQVYGDENIVFESNRHRFDDAHIVEHVWPPPRQLLRNNP